MGDSQPHAGEEGKAFDPHDVELGVDGKIRKDVKHQHSRDGFDRFGSHIQKQEEDTHAHIHTRKAGEYGPHQTGHKKRGYGR